MKRTEELKPGEDWSVIARAKGWPEHEIKSLGSMLTIGEERVVAVKPHAITIECTRTYEFEGIGCDGKRHASTISSLHRRTWNWYPSPEFRAVSSVPETTRWCVQCSASHTWCPVHAYGCHGISGACGTQGIASLGICACPPRTGYGRTGREADHVAHHDSCALRDSPPLAPPNPENIAVAVPPMAPARHKAPQKGRVLPGQTALDLSR